MELHRMVDRPFEAAAKVFSGPVASWLPVVIGPGRRTWRAQTAEGPVHVRVLVDAGIVFVHPDGVHRRHVVVRPDPTDRRSNLTAWLTPTVSGELGLAATPAGATELRFEGTTARRTGVTRRLERVVLGDRLAHSAVATLMDEVAQGLATGRAGEAGGTTAGTVVCVVPKPRRR